jgi:hypothetical protein
LPSSGTLSSSLLWISTDKYSPKVHFWSHMTDLQMSLLLWSAVRDSIQCNRGKSRWWSWTPDHHRFSS